MPNSHLRNRCAEHSNGHVWSRRCWRSAECDRVGLVEYLCVQDMTPSSYCSRLTEFSRLRNRTRELPEPPWPLPLHRRHGTCRWRSNSKRNMRRLVHHRVRSLQWFGYGRTISRLQCTLRACSMYRVVDVPFIRTGRYVRQCAEV